MDGKFELQEKDQINLKPPFRCIVHDQANVYRGTLSKAINKMSTRLVGPNTIIQAAMPTILEQVPESWHKEQNRKLLQGLLETQVKLVKL